MKEKITSLRETASQEIKNCKTRKRLKCFKSKILR